MSNPLKLMWSLWKADIIFYAVLMMLVLVYPYNSLIELILIVVLPLLLFKLWKDHKVYHKSPVPREWLLLVFNTSMVLVVLWYLTKWLGGFGLLGLAVLVVGLALWRVWKGRKLYNSFTRWSADRLKGKTKEDFSFAIVKCLAGKLGQEQAEINAAFICLAVNNHEALVRCLRNVVDTCDGNYKELTDEAKQLLDSLKTK